MNSKIVSFTDLNAWKEGHKLVLSVYKVTSSFPANEKFGLVSQMNRAVISITSNIAEGFTRIGVKDKINFYYMAKASLTELQNQLIVCKDLLYVNSENFSQNWNQTIIVHKLITGIIKGADYLHCS
ncbi:four helix bundle protein [Candidatus Shapirobacteria bacterium CG03_land_8_20_14_0_80_40_19]|uniref:Four helix bundle protein n=4 Tax=Candidatus Shapironibacteriota TaxID=1752721 RepID=A0A2M7BBJ5_9BACT|nr:MAG: four helix bundle protein [Candidatus Shapirobacteria bacterium CG11_big_fil_rev_8_21_14_0_20_40_12]PIV00469.1 MAG: four helix bundle protein [Candidatus Shapirobacteria bacterium CG03_land_8_20_14_0_80_40_19]PJC29123.1 MAG: four helix bundle protein [Candidatus Shapirobacteria bacterium CG_4_9_14_0_2_um_filter_40_11]PJC77498.1 MAG: four helix bundle protein [Candidatus Shapirobacteria bacterium CG_4_8_14_3_um_filter_39_11]